MRKKSNELRKKKKNRALIRNSIKFHTAGIYTYSPNLAKMKSSIIIIKTSRPIRFNTLVT